MFQRIDKAEVLRGIRAGRREEQKPDEHTGGDTPDTRDRRVFNTLRTLERETGGRTVQQRRWLARATAEGVPPRDFDGAMASLHGRGLTDFDVNGWFSCWEDYEEGSFGGVEV